MALHLSGAVELAAQIETVRKELPQNVEGVEGVFPGLSRKLTDAAQYLRNARNDIQLNIQPPISVQHIAAVEDLIRSVIDLLLMPAVQTASGHPVTGDALADEGYELLDQANRYKALAKHFFKPAVQKFRDGRPSNDVADEIDRVADEAAAFKGSAIRYIDKVRKEFAEAGRAMSVQPDQI